MRETLFFGIIFLMLSQPVIAQSSVTHEISVLSWLEGRWERDMSDQNRSAFEVWEKKNEALVGKGVMIQERDAVFVENLSIRFDDGQLYYVADVDQNLEPTYFKITEYSQRGFSSENPDHDFPKKIEYQLSESGELTAVISGNGQSIPFVFSNSSANLISISFLYNT